MHSILSDDPSIRKAAMKKEDYMEVLFDPVPNLDEVAFGSENNKSLNKEVAANLKLQTYETNRGGPATIEWANLYWANRLAAGLGKRVLAITISGEGTKASKPTLFKGMTLKTLTEVKKLMALSLSQSQSQSQTAKSKGNSDNGNSDNGTQGSGLLKPADYDFVFIISPCSEMHYKEAVKVGDKLKAKVVAINSPYSYSYDIGGPTTFDLTYVMKRIPKGWIYRKYPKPFECIIEGPNYEVFRATTYTQRPKLPVISKESMMASAAKYGAGGNDRIFQNRL